LSSATVDPLFTDKKNGTSNVYLISHLQRHWNDIFNMPGCHQVIFISGTNSVVYNSLLALSACHLRLTSPSSQHYVAECFQQSLALKHYRKTLETPYNKLDQPTLDGLLLSTVLLNILAFGQQEYHKANADTNPIESWVFSQHEDRLGWLALQAGVKPLMLSMASRSMSYMDDSMLFLGPILFGEDRKIWPEIGRAPNLENVPQDWITFFGLRDPNTLDVFGHPVAALMHLRNLSPTPESVYLCFQFLWKLTPTFRQLLYERNERAMWIIGCWLGLMYRFGDIWWCYNRVVKDYHAICSFLRELKLPLRPGLEGKMWKVLVDELESCACPGT
jgi:hypothetical protein